MGLNLKKIADALTDIIPLGGIAKSLVKGAGSLLFKKAAKAVGIKEEKVDELFVEASRLVEYDHEIKEALIEEEKEKRAHELAVFGRFAELDEGSQKLRARVRPLLSFGLVGLIMAYGLINLIHGIAPYLMGLEFALVPPMWLEDMAIVVVKFWFVGRTVEKVVEIYKK
jgi:hypothetical protein